MMPRPTHEADDPSGCGKAHRRRPCPRACRCAQPLLPAWRPEKAPDRRPIRYRICTVEQEVCTRGVLGATARQGIREPLTPFSTIPARLRPARGDVASDPTVRATIDDDQA